MCELLSHRRNYFITHSPLQTFCWVFDTKTELAGHYHKPKICLQEARIQIKLNGKQCQNCRIRNPFTLTFDIITTYCAYSWEKKNTPLPLTFSGKL